MPANCLQSLHKIFAEQLKDGPHRSRFQKRLNLNKSFINPEPQTERKKKIVKKTLSIFEKGKLQEKLSIF